MDRNVSQHLGNVHDFRRLQQSTASPAEDRKRLCRAAIEAAKLDGFTQSEANMFASLRLCTSTRQLAACAYGASTPF